MPKTAIIGTRVDPQFKHEIEQICAELGLTVSQAITLFLKQMHHHRGLPFQVQVPTQKTLDAIDQARNREVLARYDRPEDLYDDLGL
jgi:DNA-damage-inducible protein J